MINLYWKAGGQTYSLIEKPFDSEAALEKYIFENQEILGGDIYIIHRQIRTGSKQGIPDMIGVDQDARICIIELKNQEAGEDILPQVLQYAIWAETNPDSIKAVWLESKKKPEDIEIEWDRLDIRVILIAPSFKETVPNMAEKIGYPIDLFQVHRYCHEENEFIIVDVVEKKPQTRVGTTKVMGDWDWEFYESEHGREATAQFKQAVHAIAELVERSGWALPYNLNKGYTGFKLGNRVVFSVSWGGTYVWKVILKIPRETAEQFSGEQWEYQSYDEGWHQAVFRPLKPDTVDITELEPLFVFAYQMISGMR